VSLRYREHMENLTEQNRRRKVIGLPLLFEDRP
jgi:hypothetical protein